MTTTQIDSDSLLLHIMGLWRDGWRMAWSFVWSKEERMARIIGLSGVLLGRLGKWAGLSAAVPQLKGKEGGVFQKTPPSENPN